MSRGSLIALWTAVGTRVDWSSGMSSTAMRSATSGVRWVSTGSSATATVTTCLSASTSATSPSGVGVGIVLR